MGSKIEINDTLQITTEQGFPEELNFKQHLENPFQISDFEEKVFSFSNKKDVRIYHLPPVRIFFVHNIEGKWLYWGHVHMIEVKLDYEKQTTSGKYKIVKIFTPQEMKSAFDLIDGRSKYNFFIEKD